MSFWKCYLLMFFTKSIFWDSLGRAPWRKNNFWKSTQKNNILRLFGEGPLKKSKKPLEKQKNKKHTKKKLYSKTLWGGRPLEEIKNHWKNKKQKTHYSKILGLPPPSQDVWMFFFPRASERRVLPIVGVCISSSHLHIFSSWHLLIFTSSHLHIFSSSHLLIFTSSHLHIFSSSHLLIFTSSHFTSSHLHIFSSSHLLIFTSSHLLIFTSSDLHIFSSSHLLIFTAAHLHIFTSAHLHIFSSSHLHIFTSSHLHIFSSCPLALSFFSISLLKAGAGAVPTRRHETQPFRTKRGSIAKNWSKNCDFKVSRATLSHEMRFDRQKLK